MSCSPIKLSVFVLPLLIELVQFLVYDALCKGISVQGAMWLSSQCMHGSTCLRLKFSALHEQT